MQDPSSYVDKPDRNQKHPHYEHRTTKLMMKNNEFSEKKFQRVRRVSNKKKIIQSFKRIGKCLNDATCEEIPILGLDRVCLILINNYEHDKHDPKIGPMNDGYLIGLYHHRLGYKIFYLYNCSSEKYPEFLQFFLTNTRRQLTVFYSGRDSISSGSHGIEFKNEIVSSNQFSKIIAERNNGKCKVILISDCTAGGSVFDFQSVNKGKMISFSVNKATDPDSKEGRRSHGIFTYYFYKILYEQPNITPQRLFERMNASLKRFNETFSYYTTDKELENQPIF